MRELSAEPVPQTEIHLTEHQGTPLVAVTGEIDFNLSARFEAELAEAVKNSLVAGGHVLSSPAMQEPQYKRPMVIVDLRKVEFMDSVGLGALIGVYHDLKQEGGELRIVATDGPALTILQITDLDRVFGIYRSRDEAN